jgi:hypothetical protein
MPKGMRRRANVLFCCCCCCCYCCCLRRHICSRTTGLEYNAKDGLRSPPNVTRPGYRTSRGKANIPRNLGAATEAEVAQKVCGQATIAGADCLNWLLLGLTPAAYSSNNTADTPGRRAFISPAQVQITATLVPLAHVQACQAEGQGVQQQCSYQELQLDEHAGMQCRPSVANGSANAMHRGR